MLKVSNATSNYQAELTDSDIQLIAAMLLMMARLIPNGTAQHIARKFLSFPIELERADVEVICAGLVGMSSSVKEDRVLPPEEKLRVRNHAARIIEKLERGKRG